MKILFVTAPSATFNPTLHYRYTDVGEVLGYLKRERPEWRLRFLDGLVRPVESIILRYVAEGIDALILFSDVATAPATLRFASMAADLVPGLPILAYGRGPLRLPAFFNRLPFSAYHANGDQEHAILSFLDTVGGQSVPEGVRGPSVSDFQPGRRLMPETWGWPELDMLPLDEYRSLAACKRIPFELSLYPSKGCKQDCEYCDASLYENVIDRRRSPASLVLPFTHKLVAITKIRLKLFIT